MEQVHSGQETDIRPGQETDICPGQDKEIHKQCKHDSMEQVGPETEVNREIDLIQLQESLGHDSISNKIYKGISFRIHLYKIMV